MNRLSIPRALWSSLLVIATASANAQLLTQIQLDTVRVFESLEAALQHPEQVYRLDLSKKKLKVLPDDIRKLTNLNALELGRNRLRELPDWIVELKFLQDLSAPKNRFAQFPPQLCKLPHLKRIALSENEIEGLPACLGDLTELVSLDVWSNELSEFPNELSGMKALRFLDLRNILFTAEEMEHITELLPWATIYFSQPCNCGSP